MDRANDKVYIIIEPSSVAIVDNNQSAWFFFALAVTPICMIHSIHGKLLFDQAERKTRISMEKHCSIEPTCAFSARKDSFRIELGSY